MDAFDIDIYRGPGDFVSTEDRSWTAEASENGLFKPVATSRSCVHHPHRNSPKGKWAKALSNKPKNQRRLFNCGNKIR